MVCEQSGSTKNGLSEVKIARNTKHLLLVVSLRSCVLVSTIHSTCALLIKGCHWRHVTAREFDKISCQYFRFELVNSLSKKSRLVEQWPSSFCAAWPNDQLIYFPAQRIFSRIIITVVPTWQEDTICVSGESFYSLCANNVFWHIFTWCWLKDILSGALKECWRLMIIRSLGCHGLCLCQLKATVDNLCFVCQEHSQRTVHSACLLANHIEKISQG